MKNQKSLVISIICLLLFIILLIGIRLGVFTSLNNSIASYFLNPQGFMLYLSNAIAIAFDTLTLVIVSLVIAVTLWFYKKKNESLFLVLNMLTGAALIYLLKNLVRITRPENLIETGFSFPSGHSTISIIFLGLLIYLFIRNIRGNGPKIFISVIFSLIILLIGFTRIYLHVHWFTDIIGGFLIGGAVLFFYIYLFKKHD